MSRVFPAPLKPGDRIAIVSPASAFAREEFDRSRQLWSVLCFMIWHGIFVEGRISPKVPEPVYPVRL